MTNIIAIVLSAILQVESSGGTDLRHGDDGKAVGPYQMWHCAVDEANRIDAIYARRYGRKARVWVYADRIDFAKSEDMTELILIRFYRLGVTDPVDLACRHNRPDGFVGPEYWGKVKVELDKLLLPN